MYRYSRFSYFASRVARVIAHPGTFLAALAITFIWLVAGPFVGFDSAWQVIFSIGATVVTFLLLFLIQHTQSREMTAIQLKLNDLIRASEGTHNALLDIEELTDRDYDQIKASYTLLARQAREQLREGKFRWATARVSMETFESLLDAAEREASASGEERAEPASNALPIFVGPASAQITRQSLDRLTRIGAQAVHAPMSLLTFIEGDRQRLQSQQGLPSLYHPSQHLPLAQFESDQVTRTGKPLLIETVSSHPMASQDAALADLQVASLVAYPLFANTITTPNDRGNEANGADANVVSAPHNVIGVFTVLDTTPRRWTPSEVALLQDMATVMAEQYDMLAPLPAPARTEAASAPASAMSNVSEQAPVEAVFPSPPSDTILVVDDSQTNRLLLRQRLTREGYRVQTAADGAEALGMLKQEKPALVLLDVMMPGMDGEQVLEQMQNDPALKPIPVVMLTALDEQESVTRCLQMGARDYLLKPFDPAQLQARIRTYLHPENAAPPTQMPLSLSP